MTDTHEVDPLDAFMEDVKSQLHSQKNKEYSEKLKRETNVEYFLDEEEEEANLIENSNALTASENSLEDSFVSHNPDEALRRANEILLNLQGKSSSHSLGKLPEIDHSKIDYEPIRKDLYVPIPSLEDSPDQISYLQGIKVRGSQVPPIPKAILRWSQLGLSNALYDVLTKKMEFLNPTPIQCQAIPAAMSGRDLIGIARTGSGKTLAFLLPLFRHISDQREIEPGEGPIGLILTPTRELTFQIHGEIKKFSPITKLYGLPAAGGTKIQDQISKLRSNVPQHIIVGTPGRILELLSVNSGRVLSLKRVSFVVIDEADRMFDMGFESQVTEIVKNIRPDRQTLLFSATFPRQMEGLARKILANPVEIIVGNKSRVCSDVTQSIIVLEDESSKFFKLLEILGHWYDPDVRKILVFVQRQDMADELLSSLIKKGYACLSLHGGKDQDDRQTVINDFKSGVVSLVIATSVAARGLDVPYLELVINYDVPNHMEDYVHRVGRTGRAGKKGTAITFIVKGEDDKAVPDIIKALKASAAVIPPELQSIYDEFMIKVKSGEETVGGGGFGGKGLDKLDKERQLTKLAQRALHTTEDEDRLNEEDESKSEAIIIEEFQKKQQQQQRKLTETTRSTSALLNQQPEFKKKLSPELQNALKTAVKIAAKINERIGTTKPTDNLSRLNSRFKETIVAGSGQVISIDNLSSKELEQLSITAASATAKIAFSAEFEINDYPQIARHRVTSKESIHLIKEFTGCSITVRGNYMQPGTAPKSKFNIPLTEEKRLHLYVEGPSPGSVDRALKELKRTIAEATIDAAQKGQIDKQAMASNRYSVVGK